MAARHSGGRTKRKASAAVLAVTGCDIMLHDAGLPGLMSDDYIAAYL